jgi:hypothetical protein
MELIVIILLFILCFILEKEYRVVLYNSKKERLIVAGAIFIVLMIWELLNRFVYQAWLYTGRGLVGIYIFGLPLEIYLFYLVGPYFAFIMYELIQKEIDRK